MGEINEKIEVGITSDEKAEFKRLYPYQGAMSLTCRRAIQIAIREGQAKEAVGTRAVRTARKARKPARNKKK